MRQSMESASLEDLKQQRDYSTIAWNFLKKYWNYPDTDLAWEEIMQESRELVMEHESELLIDLLEGYFYELEKHIKEGGKERKKIL